MLTLDVEEKHLWDEDSEMFIDVPGVKLELEHSLISISKWESKWKKPFIETKEKTRTQARDYIRCMSLRDDVNPKVFEFLTDSEIERVYEYVNDPMTASSVTDRRSNRVSKKESITSELIYYWMISQEIPFECQTWHLNRLMMLIRICNAKNNPSKMSKTDLAKHNRALNAARRKAAHSKG